MRNGQVRVPVVMNRVQQGPFLRYQVRLLVYVVPFRKLLFHVKGETDFALYLQDELDLGFDDCILSVFPIETTWSQKSQKYVELSDMFHDQPIKTDCGGSKRLVCRTSSW